MEAAKEIDGGKEKVVRLAERGLEDDVNVLVCMSHLKPIRIPTTNIDKMYESSVVWFL